MMKSTFALYTAASLMLAGVTSAGFDVPRHVKGSSALDEAKAEAIKNGKPIAFVQSDPGTT